MKRSGIKRKSVIGVVVIAVVIAAIALGSIVLERTEQRKMEQELQARGEEVNATLWTNDNTVYLDGDLYGFDHRLETFLFVGTDYSGEEDPENYRGPMADFLLLMVLDHTQNTIGYIQIDRNTVTEVWEPDADGVPKWLHRIQICVAHWYGKDPENSAENTVDAVKRYLGELENIDGYFVMNLKDIGTLNHTVGGVEVTIENDLDAALDDTFTKGETLVLDDRQAERFLRSRRTSGDVGQNAERMTRQRQYMSAFFDKVRMQTMKNPKFGLELWDMLKDVAVTNMNGNDFSRIAQKLLKGENKGIHTIKGETVMGRVVYDGEEHEEFYADPESKRDEMVEMFSLVKLEDPSEDDEDEEDEEDDADIDDESEDDEDIDDEADYDDEDDT